MGRAPGPPMNDVVSLVKGAVIFVFALAVVVVGSVCIYNHNQQVRQERVDKEVAVDKEGHDAGAAGLPHEACPYGWGSYNQERWLRAWARGAAERKASGR